MSTAMNPRIGTHSHQRATARGPKHSHAMIKNEAPNPRRMLPMRASSASKCARRVSRSARNREYCSVGDTKNSLAHFPLLLPWWANCAESQGSAGFFLLAGAFADRGLRLTGLVRIAVRGVPCARNLVVVEIAHEFGSAPLLHDALQPPPGGLRTLRRATPLGIDVAHDVIHVDIVTAGRDIFGVLFLELFGFGFFAHA